MSIESNPRIEVSIPDDPELRTMAAITKDGAAVWHCIFPNEESQ